MSKRMQGQVAVVTGGAGGIGLATAQQFLEDGAAHVVICDINDADGETTVADLSAIGSAEYVHLDVTDDDAVFAAFEAIGTAQGRIDALFNCAGGSLSDDADAGELDPAVLRRTLDFNLVSAVTSSRAAVPYLRHADAGVIVNMSSWLGSRGAFSRHSYGIAKAGVSQLTRMMAGSMSREGIRVNAVAPAKIDTPLADKRITAPNYEPTGCFSWDAYPLAHGTPADVAGVVAFLCSAESRMIVGQTIMIDGGITSFF